jgi:hypothetical protein
MKPEQLEIERLRREVAKLRAERGILERFRVPPKRENHLSLCFIAFSSHRAGIHFAKNALEGPQPGSKDAA